MDNNTSVPSGKKTRGKKLLYHLARMTKNEQGEFSLWLRSPLHSNSQQFGDFLDVLLKALSIGQLAVDSVALQAMIPAFDLPTDDPAELKARDKYLGVRLSKMMQELRAFLTWKQLNLCPHLAPPLFLQALCDRNCDKYLEQNSQHPSLPACPSLVDQRKGQLAMQLSLVNHVTAKGQNDRPLEPIQSSVDDLFTLLKLKYACAGFLEGTPQSDPEQSPLLIAAIEEVERRKLEGKLNPIVEAYYCIFHMLRLAQEGDGNAEPHYLRFKAIFQDNRHWSKQDAMDLFVHAHNYCILEFQQGKTEYVQDLQQLFDGILEAGHAFQKGFLPYQFYKNAVEVMCKLQGYAWAADFTEQYHVALDPAVAPSMYAYNKAIIGFFKKDYKAVVAGLYQQINLLSALKTGIGARVYLCRALWKTQEHTWLLQQLQAFEQHLRRNKSLQETEKKRYQGFVRYLFQATKAMTGKPEKIKHSLISILTQIEEKEAPLLYRWLRVELREAISSSK